MDAEGGAQVSPKELCTKLMAAAQAQGAELKIGSVEGIKLEKDGPGGELDTVTGVVVDGAVLPCDAVLITMGPWSSRAEDWLGGGMPIPIAGLKSTSVTLRSNHEVAPF